MPTKRTLIQFYSIKQLWQFAQILYTASVEINARQKTLLCECSDAELDLLVGYGGRVIDSTVSPITADMENPPAL